MTARNISITLASLIAFSQFASAESGIRETLRDIDHHAMVVADEADELSLLSANTMYSADAHLHRLVTVKDEVNRMVSEINRLEAERTTLAPWERQAVDKALPLVNDAAVEAGKAIQYFDANRNQLWTGQYREYASEIRKDSEQIAKTLRDYLKYERVSEEEQHLKHMLD